MPAAKKPKLGAAWAEYIFLDVVGYSKRTIESQTTVVKALNQIVRRCVKEHRLGADRVIYVPTGDGMCVALLNVGNPYDIQMQIALGILRGVEEHNSRVHEDQLKFTVRIGINANRDNVVIDINGNYNVAGAGINESARIMDKADGGQILVGDTVFESLKARNKYISAFKTHPAVTVKHGLLLNLHQFVGRGHSYLNSEVPSALRTSSDARKEPGGAVAWAPHDLRKAGPKIKVEIGPTAAQLEWAKANGVELPQPLTVMALIDTGASVTVINPEVAVSCGLLQTGEVAISSTGMIAKRREYVGALRFPDFNLGRRDPVRLITLPLPGQDVACLIGRDVLENWRLVYDGRTGKVTLEE
jgi:predicted aspartyl protease